MHCIVILSSASGFAFVTEWQAFAFFNCCRGLVGISGPQKIVSIDAARG
jgi:hypothetical protein